MSESGLERSLDEIIGDRKNSARKGRYAGKRSGLNSKYSSKYQPGSRKPPPTTVSFRRDGGDSGSHIPEGSGSRLPRDVLDLSRGRPVLRVKNIHPDLNGEDLSKLFGQVSPVDFVKFDNRNDTIAYVCFHNDNQRSNGESVNKFDGKKAMGNRLIVEVATSLADRIQIQPNTTNKLKVPIHKSNPHKSNPHKSKFSQKPKQNKVKKTPKDINTLDEELNAYMNQTNESSETNNDAMNLD